MLETADQALIILNTVLTTDAKKKGLSDIQATIFCQSWEGYSYSQIAENTGYEPDYLKKVGSQLWQHLSEVLETKVSKKNVRTALSSYWQSQQDFQLVTPENLSMNKGSNLTRDWGEAIDVSSFWGRREELKTLEKWILDDQSNLVTLLGIGGVGKTALSVKLAQLIQDQFTFVVWRSLRDLPPLMDLLADLLHCLSHHQLTELPNSSVGRISMLLRYLQQHRCLILLDNAESLLQSGKNFGRYRAEYEDFRELLHRVGEVAHDSCLLLTSRELPEEVAILSGTLLPVRVLSLTGLNPLEATEIIKMKGLIGTDTEINNLVNRYQGNPLALKIATTSIQDIFAGNIAEFLKQETLVFNGIRRFLNQHLQRLSELELQVLNWLAIYREPVTVNQLASDLVELQSKTLLLETLKFLSRRSLIEKVSRVELKTSSTGFTLQPVMMEYMTEQLITQVCGEIRDQHFNSLRRYSLIQVQGKEYLREAQIRLILQPIVGQLSASFQNSHQLETHLKQMLKLLQSHTSENMAYAAGNLLNLLRLCQADFNDIDVSHLTIRQADLRGIKLHRANFAYANVVTSRFSETMGSIFGLTFSHNGKLLAISDDADIKLYQYPSYQKLLTLTGHTVIIWTVAFSGDDRLLASGSGDHTIKIWDVQTGICLRTLEGHTEVVRSLMFQPQTQVFQKANQLLASVGRDGSVKLWNVKTGKCLRTILLEAKVAQSVVFSSDGAQLAIGYADGDIHIIDLSTDTSFCLPSEESSVESPLVFSPNNKILAAGYSDGTIWLWNVKLQQTEQILQGHLSPVQSLSYSHDGHRLASSSAESTIRIWEPRSGESLKLLEGHTSRVSKLDFHPNSQILASCGEDSTVRIWDTDSGHLLNVLNGHNDSVWTVAFCPTGQTIVSGNHDKVLRIWDTNTGECLKTLEGHSERVKSVVYSSDGKILASVTYTYEVKLWNSMSGECLKTFQLPGKWCWKIALSRDGKVLASCGGDNDIHLIDVETGQVLKTLLGHSDYVLGLDFSPDGQTLASASTDRSVKLWDMTTGNCLKTFPSDSLLWSVGFHPVESLLVTGSDNGTVNLWDINQGECLKALEGHHAAVMSVSFSPNGQYIASGSLDNTVRVWDQRTGKCLHTLKAHTDAIFSVAFSPQSTLLASSSNDQTVKIWEIKTGRCLHDLRPPRLYESMNIKGLKGLSQAQIDSLKKLGAVS